MAKFPPRGYTQQQYPLPHNFGYLTQLRALSETQNTTIFTLFRTSEAAVDVENIEVNPSHPNFAEDVGPLIHNGSIVPRLSFSMRLSISKVGVETDKIQAMVVKWMPIYIAFLDSLDAEDSKTATQVEDLLELQHDTANKDTYPLFSGVNLGTGSQAISTIPAAEAFGDYGLTADTAMESVAFDEDAFFDGLSYFTNKGMLKKAIGKFKTVTLRPDRPYMYFSNNFTYPRVKRGNPYTFCGVMVHLPQAGEFGQIIQAADVTNIVHLNATLRVRFDEWNSQFEQAQI